MVSSCAFVFKWAIIITGLSIFSELRNSTKVKERAGWFGHGHIPQTACTLVEAPLRKSKDELMSLSKNVLISICVCISGFYKPVRCLFTLFFPNVAQVQFLKSSIPDTASTLDRAMRQVRFPLCIAWLLAAFALSTTAPSSLLAIRTKTSTYHSLLLPQQSRIVPDDWS